MESQTSYVLRLNNTLGRLSRAQTTWACDRSNGAACPDSGANWTSTHFPFVRKEVVETFDAASATSGATELLLSRKTVLNEAVGLGTSGCPDLPVSAQASGYSALGNLTQRYELVEDVSPEAVLSRQCSRTSSAFDESAIGPDVWWVRKPASTTVEQRVVYAEGAVPSTVASALFQTGSVQTEYVWNSTHRAPASTTVRTVNADIARNGYQTTTWTYATNQPASKYGQPDSESISGTGVTALRTTSYEYDSAGYFPARVTNPLAHAIQTVTRPIDGQPASITDADGRVTRFGYDDFGLLTATYYGPVGDLRQPSAFQGIRPCGPSAGGEPCPAGATAVRIQRAAGSPEVRTYVDGLGREVAVETQLRDVQGQVQVNGPQYNRVETHYNERGLVAWSSQPQAIRDWGDVYLTDVTTSWVPTYRRQVSGYDVLGRPGVVTEPRQLPGNSGAPGGNQKTTYTYVGLRTDIKVQEEKNGSLQGIALTMSRQVDALGRPVLTTDAEGFQNRYFYDAYGQTVALVDARGVATRAEYDPLGRRWVSYDPNLGTTQFTYNGLGELLTQTDARNRKLTFWYDALGRNTERETNGGDEFGWSTSNSVKDIFEYDPENALGQLASHRREMTGKWTASGEVDTFTERKQRFVYNAQGRLIARNTEQAINLSGQTGTRLYSHRYRWDSRWGRLLGEAWPNGVGRGYHYDGVGRVILETGLGTNMPTVLRAVQEIDARGQVVNAELGDCVTGPCIKQIRSYAPSTGQMLDQRYSIESLEGSRELHSERYRHDYLANLSQRERLSGATIALKETYTYDALQRLRTSQVYSSGSLVNDVLLEYDAVGNLTKKSDYASTYTYPANPASATRPNAVTSTYGGPTGTLYYDYDASGNLIARSPNDPAPISSNNQTFWARYNHNHQVIFSATRSSGGSTAWTAGSQYFYDAQNRLSRQVEGRRPPAFSSGAV